MSATKAALASGGITHCCLRCGLRMFFLASARSCCRWRARQCAVRRPSPRAGAGSNGRNPPGPERGSARTILLPLRRRKSAAGRNWDYICASTPPRTPPRPAGAWSVRYRNAGVQCCGNRAVAPAFAKLRCQQDAGFRQQLGGTLASRDRNAIYAYLGAVYGLVAWWTTEGREIDRARRAVRLRRLGGSDRGDPFAAVIRCTTDPAKADKRTRSKWSRVMRYAAAYKADSEALDQFVKRKGGI